MNDARVEFRDNDIKRQFFAELKEAAKAKSWKKLANCFGVSLKTFQSYLYGGFTVPGNLFSRFIENFPEEKKRFYSDNVNLKDKNWGAVLGGKRNYQLHPEIYEKGRKIAALRRKGKEETFDFDVPLSEDLCEFIGAFIGDGFTNRYGRHYWTELTGDINLDKEYLTNVLARNVFSLLGVNSTSRPNSGNNALRLIFHSKFLFKLLTERFKFPAGVKCYTVKIPEEIINAGGPLLYATIRGIFDTDGCVFFSQRKVYRKPYPRVTFQTASESLHSQVKEILSKEFSLYSYKNREKKKFAVDVYGHNQLKKWLRLIGFSNKRHLDRLNRFQDAKPWAGIEPATSC